MSRRALTAIVAVCAILVGWDLSRPPVRQVSARLLLGGIDVYQATLSRGLERVGARCRFTPSCSRYAEAVIGAHGALGGGWRALTRIARCGPWTPLGSEDPPS